MVLFACNNNDDLPIENKNSVIAISELHKDWCGSYEGWDSLMNVKTSIKKELVLNANGTYSNFIFGQMDIPNSKEGPFESEGGTYKMEIKDSLCNITFIVTYDSIIDFGTQQMIGYQHKHYHTLSGQEYERESYTETLTIGNGEKGNRRLCAVDSTLFSLDGKGQPVKYYLDVKKVEP